MLGVAAVGIAGKPAEGEGRVRRSVLGTFWNDMHEYRSYTEASTVELRQAPGAVTRLVGRFLRSIGFDTPGKPAPRSRRSKTQPGTLTRAQLGVTTKVDTILTSTRVHPGGLLFD